MSSSIEPQRRFQQARTWSLLSVVTFIGVVFHERAHEAVCGWTGVKIHKLRYFRLGTPVGYVWHERPDSYTVHILITIAPLILNAMIAFTLFSGAIWYYQQYGLVPVEWPPPAETILVAGACWVAVSCALHAFPSKPDVESLWTDTRRRIPRQLTVLLGIPVVGALYGLSKFEAMWGNVIFTGGVAAGAWHVLGVGPLL